MKMIQNKISSKIRMLYLTMRNSLKYNQIYFVCFPGLTVSEIKYGLPHLGCSPLDWLFCRLLG